MHSSSSSRSCRRCGGLCSTGAMEPASYLLRQDAAVERELHITGDRPWILQPMMALLYSARSWVKRRRGGTRCYVRSSAIFARSEALAQLVFTVRLQLLGCSLRESPCCLTAAAQHRIELLGASPSQCPCCSTISGYIIIVTSSDEACRMSLVT